MAEGERIAKRLSRAGVSSRREAERMIAEGRVRVNGAVIDSPARNVMDTDRIEVDGAPLPEAGRPRLWLYHKPPGLVTTTADEKGRATVFDALPADLPRVMAVGRLDLTSEGLLLLTNDGGVKRKLELPATGWLRKYRVRMKGIPRDEDFEPLRQGVVAEGERFQPMEVQFDRQQGANAWVTVGLREGRNREIRRAMAELGFEVNRLIRVSYGPFRLGDLKPGEVEEVRPKVLRDQLGLEAATEGHAEPKAAPRRKRRDEAAPAGPDRGKPAAARADRRPPAGRAAGAGSEAAAEGPARSRRPAGGGKPAGRGAGPEPGSGRPRGAAAGAGRGDAAKAGQGAAASRPGRGARPQDGPDSNPGRGGRPASGSGSGAARGGAPGTARAAGSAPRPARPRPPASEGKESASGRGTPGSGQGRGKPGSAPARGKAGEAKAGAGKAAGGSAGAGNSGRRAAPPRRGPGDGNAKDKGGGSGDKGVSAGPARGARPPRPPRAPADKPNPRGPRGPRPPRG